MNVLVTGATGFVGKSLIATLNAAYQVRLVMRALADNNEENNCFSVGNVDASSDWHDALDGVDIVIHLAARVHIMNDHASDPLAEFLKVNVDGTLNLAAQAFKAGVKRFVFISSVKVNGEHTEIGAPFTESDNCNPQDAYGLSKYEAEQGLLKIAQETGMEVVIIRPPLVYGAGVKANFASMLRAVKRGFPLPLGAIHNKRSFVYVGNLVSLIAKCIDHPAAANQVFLVSDGHDLSTTELLRECAIALNVKSKLFPVPQKLIEVGATLFGKKAVAQRLCDNLQVDISKARNLLDWEPPYTVADGLKNTADVLKDM